MFVIAMTLPSGYTTNDKTAASQNEQTKMIELVGDEVTGYFDGVRMRTQQLYLGQSFLVFKCTFFNYQYACLQRAIHSKVVVAIFVMLET